MNNNELTTECVECNEKVETIAEIVRRNSCFLSSVHGNIVTVKTFVDGTSNTRDTKDPEPCNLREELLWQRMMLSRIEEELHGINETLGV